MAMITCVVSCACMILTAVTTTFKWKLQSAASSFGDNRALNEKKLKKLKCSSSAYLSFCLILLSFFTLILRPGTWLLFSLCTMPPFKTVSRKWVPVSHLSSQCTGFSGIKFLYLISGPQRLIPCISTDLISVSIVGT